MSKLPAMTCRDVIHRLRSLGFVFDRYAKGPHQIWYNPHTRRRVMVSEHPGDVPQGTLRKIIRSSGVSLDEFLGRATRKKAEEE